MNIVKDERGVITLEACVTLFAFLLLMFFMASFFSMFRAQNAIAHAVLETSQSLSVDAFAAEQIGTSGGFPESVKDFVLMIGNSDAADGPFATNSKWYEDGDSLASSLKTRFLGYLVGGDGYSDDANKVLKGMRIERGVDGFDFSGSYIDDDMLYVVLRYNYVSDFQLGNISTIPAEQKACSRLWRKAGSTNGISVTAKSEEAEGSGGASERAGESSSLGSTGGGVRGGESVEGGFSGESEGGEGTSAGESSGGGFRGSGKSREF